MEVSLIVCAEGFALSLVLQITRILEQSISKGERSPCKGIYIYSLPQPWPVMPRESARYACRECRENIVHIQYNYRCTIKHDHCYMMLILTKLKMTSSLSSASSLHTLISMLSVVGCGSVVQNHGGLLS